MTLFTLVRHGETVAIQKGLFSGGKSDDPLTEEGLIRTDLFIRNLSAKECDFDACITSRMKRAKAFGLFFEQIYEKPVFADPRLDEKDAGVFEGCKSNHFFEIGYEEKHQDRWLLPLPGGESHLQVAERGLEALRFWESVFPDGSVLIGSHTDVIRSIKAVYDMLLLQDKPLTLHQILDPISFRNPTDQQLTMPVPYFFTVEIDSTKLFFE